MSLLPVQYPITVWYGATWRQTITWLTGAVGSNPVDLTGYTATMPLRTDRGATPFYTLSTANSDIVLGTTSGVINLYIPATITSTLQNGIYELDLIDTGNTGDIFPLLWGQFVVEGISEA